MLRSGVGLGLQAVNNIFKTLAKLYCLFRFEFITLIQILLEKRHGLPCHGSCICGVTFLVFSSISARAGSVDQNAESCYVVRPVSQVCSRPVTESPHRARAAPTPPCVRTPTIEVKSSQSDILLFYVASISESPDSRHGERPRSIVFEKVTVTLHAIATRVVEFSSVRGKFLPGPVSVKPLAVKHLPKWLMKCQSWCRRALQPAIRSLSKLPAVYR